MISSIIPKIGVECEFFLEANKQVDFNKLIQIGDDDIILKEESGYNQFEFSLKPSSNIGYLVQKFYSIQQRIKKFAKTINATAIFLPVTDNIINYEFGSAIHIHINFFDQSGENIFSFGRIEENRNLIYSIGGILSNIKSAQYFLMPNDIDYERIKRCKMSPNRVSWGGNNRSVLLRIPDSNKDSRRIEFRLLSGNSDLEKGILYLIYSSTYGMKYKILPMQRMYGNADHPQYNLTPLFTSLEEAKTFGSFNESIIQTNKFL